MKKRFVTLLATSAVLCTMGSAIAGEREGAFSISPFVGGYTFDGVQHLKTAPVAGLRLGYDLTKNWGVEAVVDALATKGTHSDKSVNALSYRLDVLYNLLPDGPVVPYLAVGGGGITLGHGSNFQGGSNTDATANAGLGVKYFLSDSVALRGDARQLFLFEEHNSVMYNWEYTAGLTFLFGGKKPAPPVVAQPAAAPVEPPPAPPAPTTKLTVTPGSITKGQPATLSWSSQNATKCEITPGVGTVGPQGSITVTPATDASYSLSCNGPGGTATDSAKVAVAAPPAPKVVPAPTSTLSATPASINRGEQATLNWTSQNATKCAIQPQIGPVQPQGTRTVTPADNTAYTLQCEGEGGTTTSAANVAVTVPAPVVEQPKAAVKLCSPTVINVQFDTNKTDIKPQYHDELKKIGDFLKEFPQAKGVVEGHTDNVGDKAANMKLSQRRAESVRNYIINNFGIAPDRIAAKGYGPTKPVTTNKTKQGKAQNRRIEANFRCE